MITTSLDMISAMACDAAPLGPRRAGPALAVLAILLLAGNAAAVPHTPPMMSGSAALTPLLMRFFCNRDPHECLPQPRSVVEWSGRLQARLQRVNQEVNKTILPLANPPDGWDVGPQAGDCNDYALTKRSQLIELGVPAGALHIAITDTPHGQAHAVLVVRTTAGDVVLDNLGNALKSLPLSGYAIRSMSSPDPLQWIIG